MGKLKVLLTTEGTYPFHQGGVSTWCDILVQKLDQVEYTVYSVMMDPFITQKFSLPEDSQLIKMPLWGTEEPSEHLSTPFSLIYLKKKRTTAAAIKKRFLPLFKELIEEILSPTKDPHDFGRVLLGLHKFFQEYEYKVSFKSEEAWEVFKEMVLSHANQKEATLPQPDVYGLIQSLGWVYRFLNILNTPIPRVNVTHASAAAFCGIPCVLAKLEYNTPFLLTEHGVYLREQYLSLAKRKLSSYLNTFLIRMIHSVTALNYAFADQVSPVCYYNTRWEKRFGVSVENIDVIYNGVDKTVFTEASNVRNLHPTVVTVARIDPIKDILTLIESAEIVRKKIPNVKYIVYGSVSVPSYYDECVALVNELGLQETFIFAGHTSNMVQAYHSGDVIALSSISEAFPYSVVEAMMTGKPVVTTDVGGIREALGDTGILVEPRNPAELADGLITLLTNERLRLELGEEARKRALSYFTLDQVLDLHLKAYLKLSLGVGNASKKSHDSEVDYTRQPLPENRKYITKTKQMLLAEKGYALLSNGFLKEAIVQFQFAVQEEPQHPSVPIYLTEIAKAYNALGEHHLAINEMEKINTFVYLKEIEEQFNMA